MSRIFFHNPMIKDLRLIGITTPYVSPKKVVQDKEQHEDKEDEDKQRKKINRITNENRVYDTDQNRDDIDKQYKINKHSSLQRYINKHGNFLKKNLPKTLLRRIRHTQEADMSR